MGLWFRSDAWHQLGNPVTPAVVPEGRGEEPRIAAIEWPRRKAEPVEPRYPLLSSKHLLADAHAEIARHADARAAIAHGVKQAVVLSDMRQLVECVGDKAAPGMADLRAGELREQPHQLGMEQRATSSRIGLVGRDAATEQDAPAVG